MQLVSSHIPAITNIESALRNLEFIYGIDCRLTNLDFMGAWLSTTSLRTALVYQAIYVISVIEDVHDITGCTLYIKKKVGVIKRCITSIHNSVWLQWWRKAPSSSPYYIMKVTDVTFTIQIAEILVRISHKYDTKERRNVALMTRGLCNKISTPIDLINILNHCTFCRTTVHISEKHEVTMSS